MARVSLRLVSSANNQAGQVKRESRAGRSSSRGPRWAKRAYWAWHKLNAAPPAVRIVVIAAAVFAVFSAANVIYQLVRKPTEMFFP